MAQPIKVSAEKHVDPTKLKQIYYNVEKNIKLSLLVHLLNEKSGLVMVFCNTRRTTDFVVKNLRKNKIDAVEIHGGLSQNKRSRTIELFNKGRAGVLVCTDVAARGLDINNVSHIYNYEIPKDPIDYVHRIGRTARAGEEGIVVNLLCQFDHDNFSRVLREHPSFTIQNVEKPLVERVIAIKDNSFENNNFKRNNSFRGQSGRRYNNFNRQPRRSNSFRGPSERRDNNFSRQPRSNSFNRQSGRRDNRGSNNNSFKKPFHKKNNFSRNKY